MKIVSAEGGDVGEHARANSNGLTVKPVYHEYGVTGAGIVPAVDWNDNGERTAREPEFQLERPEEIGAEVFHPRQTPNVSAEETFFDVDALLGAGSLKLTEEW